MRGATTKTRMRSHSVVLEAPGIDGAPRTRQARESVCVDTIMTQLAVEAFAEGILDRLPRANEMHGRARFAAPLGRATAGSQKKRTRRQRELLGDVFAEARESRRHVISGSDIHHALKVVSLCGQSARGRCRICRDTLQTTRAARTQLRGFAAPFTRPGVTARLGCWRLIPLTYFCRTMEDSASQSCTMRHRWQRACWGGISM